MRQRTRASGAPRIEALDPAGKQCRERHEGSRGDQRFTGTLLATLYGVLKLVPEKVGFVRA